MSRPSLPEFESPPAVETMMGFHFAPIPDWSVLRLGQVWAEFHDAYPEGDVYGPITPNNSPVVLSGASTSLNQMPLRAILATQDRSELLQIQGSAFLRNWRKNAESMEYTHYSQLKPRFLTDWKKFLSFLESERMPMAPVFQCEVTYVNHLIRGKHWESYSDLSRWVKFFAETQQLPEDTCGRAYSYLPDAANLGLSVGYTFPDNGLTLQFVAQSAVTMPEGAEILLFTVSAKAPPADTSDVCLSKTLDDCHDSVIRGFHDATTDFAHQQWRKL